MPPYIMNKQDKDVFSHYFHLTFFGSSIQKKKKKCHPGGKQRSKTGFIPRRHDYLGDNWIESSKKATRMSEFIKAAWYKMNTQTSIIFLYASNEQSEI